MDLSTFGTVATAEEGAVMNVCNPATGAELRTEAGEPVWIRFASSDSERVKRVARKAANRRLSQARGGRVTVTAEALDAEGLNTLLAATMDWGNIDIGDGPLELSDENARRVYVELPWLREQGQAFVDDRGNFVKASRAA